MKGLMGVELQFGKTNGSEADDGHGYTAPHTRSMSLTVHLKTLKMVLLRVFTTIKNL